AFAACGTAACRTNGPGGAREQRVRDRSSCPPRALRKDAAAARAHRRLGWPRQFPRHGRALVAAHPPPAAAADPTFAHCSSAVSCPRGAGWYASCPATHGDPTAAASTSSPAATRRPYRRPPVAQAATSLLAVLLVNAISSGRSTSDGASVPPAASAKMGAAAGGAATDPARAAPTSARPRPERVAGDRNPAGGRD